MRRGLIPCLVRAVPVNAVTFFGLVRYIFLYTLSLTIKFISLSYLLAGRTAVLRSLQTRSFCVGIVEDYASCMSRLRHLYTFVGMNIRSGTFKLRS